MTLVLNQADLKTEYEKNKNITPQLVADLKGWAERQAHLPPLGDLELILFLHASHNKVEKAKILLDKFFTIRTRCPEIFSNRDLNSDEIKTALNLTIFSVLPGLTKDGYKIMYMKLYDPDPYKFVYIDHIKVVLMVSDLLSMQLGTSKGYVIVYDMNGVSLTHLFKMKPFIAKKVLYYLQEAAPVVIKRIHIINLVWFFDKGLTLLKPFLSKRLMDIIHLHSKLDEDFFEQVPHESLPKEYGGDANTLEELHDDMKKNVYENEESFKKGEKLQVNENLRKDKSVISDEVMDNDFSSTY